MTLYIGVDIHARPQTVSYLDTEDGTLGQQGLHHERDDVRAEVIVGIEACGYTNWFEELMEELGQKLLVGDAAEIRRLARRRQKNDRRDADLLLELLVHDEFPALFGYSPESRELLRQLRYRHKLVKLRTMPVAPGTRVSASTRCSALDCSEVPPRTSPSLVWSDIIDTSSQPSLKVELTWAETAATQREGKGQAK